MATLADLFNQKSQDIYKRFTPKQTPDGQPYVSIIPDTEASRSRIKDDNRAIPVVSTIRDQSRISKFLSSSDGRLFISKQLLLQTGNTFVNTKIFNPISTRLSAIPFLHPRRHLVQTFLRSDISGLLQIPTINTISNKFEIIGQLQSLPTNITGRGLLRAVGSVAKSYLATQLKNAASAIIPIPQTYLQSRPEYSVFKYNTPGGVGPVLFDVQPLNQRSIIRLGVTANIKAVITSKVRSELTSLAKRKLNLSLPKALRGIVPTAAEGMDEDSNAQFPKSFEAAAAKFRKTFYDKNSNDTRLKNKYFNENSNGVSEAKDKLGRVSAKPSKQESEEKYRDQYNVPKAVSIIDQNKINYASIITPQETLRSEGKTDIIKFIFSEVSRDSTNVNPVKFRALLSSIKESIKTEFNEQRYIGRTERFVTYGGAKRGVNLGFNIVAFSQDEIDGMWSRVNYLSGLAFPKDVKNGFMVPPLFNITVGGIYDNQPCYIESLDYDFLDESITFDIDKEVPFAINVTMQLSILEKRSKFYDSPFYQITERIANEQYQSSVAQRDTRITG